MTKALSIFRKDLRHLWPHVVAFLILMAFAAVLDPTFGNHGQSSAYSLLAGFALPLACWNLIVAVIHEEKLIGDRQYWLTRPYGWQQLLGAKAIFLLALISLPLLVWHTAAYLAVGIPVWQHFPALVCRQFFFSATYILPALVLAVITRGLGQIILTTLLIVLPSLFLESFVFARYRLAWLNIESTVITAIALFAMVGTAAILVFQYAHRNTRLSRIIAAAMFTGILGVAVVVATVWGGSKERALSWNPEAADSSIHVSLDPGRQSPYQPWGQQQNVTVDIPIRLTGSRTDLDYVPTGLVLSIEGGDHRTWYPPRTNNVAFHDSLGETALLRADIDRFSIDWLTKAPVNIRGSIDFDRFGNKQFFPLPKDRPTVIPKVGVCTSARDERGFISLICYTPDPRASVIIGTTPGRSNWIIPKGFVNTSIPTSSDVEPLTKFTSLVSYPTWNDMGTTQLMTSEALPPVRVEFDLPAVDLRRYVVIPR